MSQKILFWLDVVQVIAVTVTLFILIKYTYETYKLRRETEKQTELTTRPFVVISYAESEDTFKYTNIGFGIALNIRLDDLILFNTDGLSFEYIFPLIAVIPPGTECEISNIKMKINNQVSDTEKFDLGALLPRSAQRTFNVSIRYENSIGDEYVTKGKLGQETFDYESLEKIGEGPRNIWKFFERRDKWIKKTSTRERGKK